MAVEQYRNFLSENKVLSPASSQSAAMVSRVGMRIAHAVAKHGNERMSQAMVQQLGGVALQVALAQQPQQTQELFLMSYGIGSTVGAMLPWSRQQEAEAIYARSTDLLQTLIIPGNLLVGPSPGQLPGRTNSWSDHLLASFLVGPT